jgi:cyanobactin maturation PatA/PatG family protease
LNPGQLVADQAIDALAGVRLALADAAGGVPSVKIGIIDGLPDLTHPALQGAAIEILEMMVPDGCWAPDPHGTGICSVIFGQSDVIRGIAPGCSGLGLPIFFGSHNENRPRPASQLDLARALTFALEHDVSIMNVSAGQRVLTPAADAHLDQALQRCAERRVLVIAAAGNDGCACLHLPAAISSVLAVGAIDDNGVPLPVSNWGESYRRNGILAPGHGLTVAVPGGGIGTASGTSYATAVVSGVAALLLSVARREGHRADAVDVGRILIEAARPCRLSGEGACDRFLVGTLDAAAALAMLRGLGGAGQSDSSTPSGAGLNPSDAVTEQLHTSTGEDRTMTEATIVPGDAAVVNAGGRAPAASGQRPAIEPSGPQFRQLATSSSPPASPAVQTQFTRMLSQQDCACGGGQPPQIVYAIGSLWFDFGSEARHDRFIQLFGGDVLRANNPNELITFLRGSENLYHATGLTFILMQEEVPLYAIQPAGPFAVPTYNSMLETMAMSLATGGDEQRISLPGFISGTTRLLNGMNVPTVYPDLRGMYRWRSEDLIANTKALDAEGPVDSDQKLLDFLNIVYYGLRNFGVAPQDRALNFAATNAYQAREALAHAARNSLVLSGINVVKSPICRPDSDCWDVELVMFDDDPERIRPSWTYRYTVDVSEVIPVTIGRMRYWPTPTSS